MASRQVGIEAPGYPLLYQYITVRICSPLLDIKSDPKKFKTDQELA